MTITLRPDQEKIVSDALACGRFQSVDDMLDKALAAIVMFPAPTVHESRRAGDRIRQLRQGLTLGDVTIKELIEEGRE